MFGLFQSDLPIGERLWFTIIALVLGGSIASEILLESAKNPASFAINLLLIYGQAMIVTAILLTPLVVIMEVIELFLKRRTEKEISSFIKTIEKNIAITDRVADFLLLAGYVIVVFWISYGHFNKSVGALGLALGLVGTLLNEWGNVYLWGYEVIELHLNNTFAN